MVEINGINVVSEGRDSSSVTQANQSEARLRRNSNTCNAHAIRTIGTRFHLYNSVFRSVVK